MTSSVFQTQREFLEDLHQRAVARHGSESKSAITLQQQLDALNKPADYPQAEAQQYVTGSGRPSAR